MRVKGDDKRVEVFFPDDHTYIWFAMSVAKHKAVVGALRCAVAGEWLVLGSRGVRVAASEGRRLVRRHPQGSRGSST